LLARARGAVYEYERAHCKPRTRGSLTKFLIFAYKIPGNKLIKIFPRVFTDK